MGGTVSTLDNETEVSLSLDEAQNNGIDVQQADGLGKMYGYVLTDQNNAILDATFETNVELATLDTGNYRVYGLALNGNYSGMVGADIQLAQLSDECFALSENFIAVAITATSNELEEVGKEREVVQTSLVELRLWPNPVNDQLTYEMKVPASGKIQVMVFNTFGQQVLVQQESVEQTSMQSALDVSELENGIYLLAVTQNGKLIAKERFVKVE
jgi:hypothetical protein